MAINTDIWRIINKCKTGVTRTKDSFSLSSDTHFKRLPDNALAEINAITDNELLKRFNSTHSGMKIKTYSSIVQDAENNMPSVINNYKASSSLLGQFTQYIAQKGVSSPESSRVLDSMYRQFSGGMGGIGNFSSSLGIQGADPRLNSRITPNVFISPIESRDIYSQKGLYELVINKKGKSPLLNGVRIKNPYYSSDILERVNNCIISTKLDYAISQGMVMSLITGGSLLFPFFNNDTPLTTGIPVVELIKLGVVKKGCISYFASLDRLNTVHIPSWNPTSYDFRNPERYYIPFLGGEVHRSRCARIVTAPQDTYYGTLMTMGWGISDYCGWVEAAVDLDMVMKAIPSMIHQMGLLVRQINLGDAFFTEGIQAMNMLEDNLTVKMREASAINPEMLDVLGELTAIDRDFKEVPQLVRLMRQHTANKIQFPEEGLWSSEKGAFAGGSSSDDIADRQWESVKYIHMDVAGQLTNLAKLLVIHSEGVGKEVLKYLPFTTISFENPRTTDAKKKSDIAKNIADSVFALVGSRLPMVEALQIGQKFSDEEFQISPQLMRDLVERQDEIDAREEEKHDMEMELLAQQIQSAKDAVLSQLDNTDAPKAKPSSSDTEKKGHSYEDRLTQKQHEVVRTGGAKRQGLAKKQAKIES